jgi:hypothetical protein
VGSGVDPIVDRLTGGGQTDSQDSVAVEWDGDELRESQLVQLRRGRMLLRSFLNTVRQVAAERGGIERVAMLPLYTDDQRLLELELLAAEADNLGIEIGDGAVLDYLEQLADGTVSASEYGQLLRTSTNSNLSESQLLDLMARELKAYKVLSMAQSGGYPASPIAAWDYYNRLNRFVRAEMMPISVDDYLDEVEDPNEIEVVEMYEKHKKDYPFPRNPEPGFRKREQRAFQYVKVDFDAILEVEKAAVTDEEVKRYYDENKEQYRKVMSNDDLSLQGDDKASAPGVDTAEETDAATNEDAESAPGGESAVDAVPEVEETQSPDAPVETDTPEPNSGPDPSPTALPQDDDAVPPPKDDDDEQPVQEDDEQPVHETVTEETDAAATNGDTVAVDENDEASKADVATEAVEQPPAEATDDEATETEVVAEVIAAEEIEEADAATTAVEPSDLDPVANDEPLYEALADVADDIRRAIASPRAQAKMNKILDDVKRELDKYHAERTIWEIELETDSEVEEPPLPNVSAFADGDRVVVGDIPLIDSLQAEDYELGRAFDLDLRLGVQRKFAQTAFSDKTSPFNPQVIPDFDIATSRFVYWMTDAKEEYVPDLDQVRSEVVQAIKRQRAVGLALKDAKTLAEKAGQQDAPLAASLPGRENAEFIDTGEISWVTPPMTEGATPQISVIPGVEDASPELRESLFRLAQGEVGYATNMPKTKVYIFRVEEVNPPTEQRREQFLRNGVDAPVLFLARRDSFVGLSQWYRNLSEQRGVQWKRDPRASDAN